MKPTIFFLGLLFLISTTNVLGQKRWCKKIWLKDRVSVHIRTKKLVNKCSFAKPIDGVQFYSKDKTLLSIRVIDDIPKTLNRAAADTFYYNTLIDYARNVYHQPLDSSYIIFDTLKMEQLEQKYYFVDLAYTLIHKNRKSYTKRHLKNYTHIYERFLLFDNKIYIFTSNQIVIKDNPAEALKLRNLPAADFKRLVHSIQIK